MRPEAVLLDLREALQNTVVGLYAHGSLVAGDFAPERSDLDVLAVLPADPDDRLLRTLAGLHTGIEARHPEWAGRIEVEYVGIDTVREAATDAITPGRLIARISPGETLHLLPATRHRVVTWATVHDSGRRLVGPPAATLLPDFAAALVRAALLDHVRDWPTWVESMTAPGAQSYSVLSLCRAVQRLRYGRQLSKRQAADRTARLFGEWAPLIEWARDWWYEGGADTDTGRDDAVRRFVIEVSAGLLADQPSR